MAAHSLRVTTDKVVCCPLQPERCHFTMAPIKVLLLLTAAVSASFKHR